MTQHPGIQANTGWDGMTPTQQHFVAVYKARYNGIPYSDIQEDKPTSIVVAH